jgi:hypothetical protein
MTFVCPIAHATMPAWQAAVHVGLMVGVLVAGAILLASGVVAYRR